MKNIPVREKWCCCLKSAPYGDKETRAVLKSGSGGRSLPSLPGFFQAGGGGGDPPTPIPCEEAQGTYGPVDFDAGLVYRLRHEKEPFRNLGHYP